MRKIIMILILVMVAFGSFAKDFEYKSNDDSWKYSQKQRTLCYEVKLCDTLYTDLIYDVSENEAWKIINGEEFPAFRFFEYKEGNHVITQWMPCRDYSNRR